MTINNGYYNEVTNQDGFEGKVPESQADWNARRSEIRRDLALQRLKRSQVTDLHRLGVVSEELGDSLDALTSALGVAS